MPGILVQIGGAGNGRSVTELHQGPSSNGSYPEQERRECDRCFVGGGGLLVSRGDAAEALEPVEAAFDGVASAVGLAVEDWRPPAAAAAIVTVLLLVGLLGDGVCDAAFAQVSAEAAGAVRLVRDDLAGSAAWSAKAETRNPNALQQGACADAVVSLARCHEDGQGTPAAVAGEVDLGGQSAAGPSDGMVVGFAGRGPFLRPPAACWWARTIVEPPKPPSRGPHRCRPGPSER